MQLEKQIAVVLYHGQGFERFSEERKEVECMLQGVVLAAVWRLQWVGGNNIRENPLGGCCRREVVVA